MDIKVGHTYKHSKGGVYKIIRIAKHSETLEDLVVYENKKGDVWARPISMFFDKVEKDGKKISRFFLQK